MLTQEPCYAFQTEVLVSKLYGLKLKHLRRDIYVNNNTVNSEAKLSWQKYDQSPKLSTFTI